MLRDTNRTEPPANSLPELKLYVGHNFSKIGIQRISQIIKAPTANPQLIMLPSGSDDRLLFTHQWGKAYWNTEEEGHRTLVLNQHRSSVF